MTAPRLTDADRRRTDQARELETALGTIAGLRERYNEKDPAALLVFLSGEARYLLAEQQRVIDRLSETAE